MRLSTMILIVILALGLFFRIYNLQSFYTFDHDQDLFAWIVKDILIDHHFRLIGNLTRVDGVFIGPLYFYLLVPFFAVFKMNPLSAVVPTVMTGLLTIASIYFVFSKLFGKNAGLIGAFLYAVSINMSFLDRLPIPTQPTILWSVWLLYTLFSLLKGEKTALLLAGILIGLIWHIHIVFMPLILLFPLAMYLSKMKITYKNLIFPSLIVVMLMLPFVIFELRHGFQQINGLITAITEERTEARGFERVVMVIGGSAKSLQRAFNTDVSTIAPLVVFTSLILSIMFLNSRKILSKGHAIIIFTWIMLSMVSQQVSKRSMSDYYFNNLTIIPILVISLLISYLIAKGKFKKIFAFILLFSFFSINLFILFSKNAYENGYLQKKRIVQQIASDARKNNYPCVGINFLAFPGVGVGFRYMLWLNGLKEVRGAEDVPVYNITIPYNGLAKENKIGGLGLILPEKMVVDEKICKDPNKQLLPLLGFTG